MRYMKLILSFLLFLSAFIGDYIVFKSKYSDTLVFRAITDSLVHGMIGFLSASLFFSHKICVSTQTCVLHVVFCTMVSSLIDIDHVFVAKSIYLKDMTNLKQRGIFHCTTFWLLVTILFLLYSYIAKKLHIYTFTYMLILAFTSHHIRDGNRRGVWVYPLGHTPPINKYLYALLISILPNIFAYIYVYMKAADFKESVEYMVV